MLVFSPLSPLSEKAAHWLLVLGITARITKYDVNDSVSIKSPDTPDKDVSPSLLLSPPVTYLVRLVPAQDVHIFYTRSHLSALQNCALTFSANF